ncbi:MAG: hypothetical protein FJY97_07090 [candidate division Zixibacteria bacterium]|nr:hypothetical protein [candidate division Zixibacteria bacterium]
MGCAAQVKSINASGSYYLANLSVGPIEAATTIYDGFLRVTQSRKRTGDQDIVTQTTYSRMSQPDSLFGAVGRQESYVYAGFGSGQASGKVTTTSYFNDPLGRAKQVIPPGNTSAHAIRSRYGNAGTMGSVPIRFTTTVDENGVIVTQYHDALGHLIKTVADSGNGTFKNATTTFTYDAMDQVTETATPLKNAGTATGDVSKYWYDTHGRQVKKYQPDADTTRYKYDKLGRLPFSQDAVQSDSSRVTFLVYDVFGRITRIGEVAATFSTLDPDASQSFDTNDA